MAAQALYLKYRPRTFDEVAGQEAITRTLRNALRQGRIRHAYLFTGPRGTGKTTTARLLAKAVNCLAPEAERPCNACAICTALNEGRLLDLIEIDAASNRGIDEIRDIREKVGFRPNQARYKVYVLDEAHMLTEPAFNALLKTLEEPPPHVIFILVTTDPHKIPATITSRCQRFDFKRISVQAIADRLAYIAQQEGLSAEPAALDLIARQSTGAMRDAVSLLDQLMSYGEQIALDQVQMVLGAATGEAAGQLVSLLARGDVADGLTLINRVVGDGADPRQFGREVVEYLRGLLLIKQGAGTRLLNATAEQAADMEALALQLSTERLLEAIHLFNRAVTDLKSGLQTIPHLPLEMALVESSLEASAAPRSPQAVKPPEPERTNPPINSPPEPRLAGSAPPVQTPVPSAKPLRQQKPPEQAVAETKESVPPYQAPAPSGTLTLEQVQGAWSDVLRAVRQRNPATQGMLNTGCRVVAVVEDQIVVIYPYPFMREKLEDAQRKQEVQDALDSVLGVRSRLKWVLEAEYAPRNKPTTVLDDQAVDEISRWAAEHGGQTTILQP